MRHLSSRLALLPLAAVLGTGCLVIDPGTDTPKDPCSPNNPCTQGDKTQCVNEDGNARCLCKAGTVQRPSGACEPLSAANCPEHFGDSSEPDDCLARAVALSGTSAQRQQSIEPVGDYDFFRIDATLRNVYSLTVEPGTGSLMPRVDVFDQEGLWVTSADGRPKAQAGFKARATAPYYVRVSHSPLDPSPATGLYALTYASLGADDYGDNATDSPAPFAIVPDVGGTTSPADHYGKLEYGQDVDWFSIAATQGTTYRIDFDTARTVPAVAVYTSLDVKNPYFTSQGSFVEFKASSSTTYYFALYSVKGEPGSYAFRAYRY